MNQNATLRGSSRDVFSRTPELYQCLMQPRGDLRGRGEVWAFSGLETSALG